MKKKILAKRSVQKPQPGGLVHAAANAPVKIPAPHPKPTEEQAALAYKITCNTPAYGELRKEAEALLLRYLKTDMNPQADLPRTSGFAYVPGGGTLTTTASGHASVWGVG